MEARPWNDARGRVLIIEDDSTLAQMMFRVLCQEQYVVNWGRDGQAGLDYMRMQLPDVVILDLTLPGMDGLEVCRRIREIDGVGILIVSGRTSTTDRIRGLQAGADDYLPKPFDVQELVLRVANILRRMRGGLELAPLTRYLDHDVMVDAARGFIYRGEECIPLVPLETKVLACLVRRMGEVVPFEEIIREVWGPGFEDPAGRNSLRVYINHLRQKLGDDARNPRFLFTRWKWGYKLQANRV